MQKRESFCTRGICGLEGRGAMLHLTEVEVNPLGETVAKGGMGRTMTGPMIGRPKT